MYSTNDLIGQSGVIGEENNRLLMYLVFTSRKREEPLHVISLGSSGTGKTHLQSGVGELIPQEDVIQITSLSENALYYFRKQELKHKLILIEDLDGAGEVLYPLAMLCPECAFAYGGLQVYSGVKTGNSLEVGSGILNMAGGGLGLYAKYSKTVIDPVASKMTADYNKSKQVWLECYEIADDINKHVEGGLSMK